MTSTPLVTTTLAATLIAAVLIAPLSADVKTRERTQVKFEGFIGGLINRMSGQGADGLTSDVAVRGNRKATVNDRTGQIIDLDEEKIYEIDVRRKEYRVTTFEEMRERMRKAQADAEKQAQEMPSEERQDLEEAGKEIEIDFDVRETGATRAIAGHNARQVVLTVTMREKGRTLEESGGMVMTTDSWLGPRVPALDEIHEFDMKYFKAVYGEFLPSMAQLGAMAALYPGIQKLMARAEAESGKLEGTPLASTMTIETVRSAEALAAQPAPSGGGGGLSGRLARRVAGSRGAPQPRSTLVTSTQELLSVETSASAADVALPAGFRERK
jgi:hypothetical protein